MVAPAEPAGGVASRECTVQEGLRALVQLLPRVMRGMRRRPEEPASHDGVDLGPRHGSALSLLREHDWTVGELAEELGLTLATVSGLIADLERVRFVERSSDPADRRRTIVAVKAGQEARVDAWMEGATASLVRTLVQLTPEERATFVKALGVLDTELNASGHLDTCPGAEPIGPVVPVAPARRARVRPGRGDA